MDRSKYLSPWTLIDVHELWHLPFNDDDIQVEFGIWRVMVACKWHSLDRSFATKEEAMNYTDMILIDRGYVLLTQNQFDKLQVLI